MLNNLLESKAKKERSVGGQIVSIVLHSILITGAVYATARATTELEKPKEEKVEFVEVAKKEEPPPEPEKTPPPPDVVVAPPPPKGFQVLTAPVDIPDVLPDIDLTKKVTDEADFTGKGVAGGVAKGVEGGVPQPIVTDQPYFEFQVEKPAAPAGGCSPKYPDMLRTAGVEGTVLAQFVVDTSGRAEPASFKALQSPHDLFSVAVKNALSCARYLPAEVGGRKVKQLVQQPFAFGLAK